MTRLLYEVAVLTERTRNRDVQWEIQPICTSNNCSIHPSFLHNDLGVAHEQRSIFNDDHLTGNATEANTDIFSDCCISENTNGDGTESIFSDHCISENAVGATAISSMESAEFVAKSFEIGQSISGYSTAESQFTGEISQPIESNEFCWLKNPYIVRDLTTNGSCEESVQWHDGSVDFDQWNAQRTETRNSMNPFTTDIEVAYVPASSSIRQNAQAQNRNTEDNYNDKDKDKNKGKDTNAAVISDAKENEESRMSRRARTFRDVLLGLRPANDLLSDEEDSNLESNISEVNHQLNKLKHKPISNPSMSLSVPEPDNTGRDMASACINKMPEFLVNGAHASGGGQDDGEEAQSAPAQMTLYSQVHKGRIPAVGEERRRVSVDSSFGATSPQAKALTDSESANTPTRKVKKNKRWKLAAHFSGQNRDAPRASLMNIFPLPNLNFNFPADEEQTKRKSPSAGSTDIRDRNCVHTSRRAAIRNDKLTGIHLDQTTGIPNDSGLCMNGTNLTGTQASIEIGHMTESKLEITEVETDATSGVSSECYSNSMPNMNKRIVLQNSPYKCKIPHGYLFVPLLEYHLPKGLQTRPNLEALLSISQRVVRIGVRKPYIPIDPFLAKEYQQMQSTLTAPKLIDNTHKKTLTDHYGTGFAFYIDENHIQIRTHSHLVSSSEEARNTLIQFNIYDPACSGQLTIECMGTSHGFYTNCHSQVTVLTCVTPPDIKSLRLFRECPTISRSSVFNDSCYFTDSSAESSFVGFEEGSMEAINPNSTTMEDLISIFGRVEYIWGNGSSNERPRSPILSEFPEDVDSPKQLFQEVKLPDLCPCHAPPRRSQIPILEHADCERCKKNGTPDNPHQMYGRRRLKSNERAAHSSIWNNPTELLQVPGFEIGFIPFNSFAADLIDSSLAKSTHCNVSPFIGPTEHWDYASLIFAQSYHKDEYYNSFKRQVYNHGDTGNQDEETARNQDEETARNQDEEATGNQDEEATGNQDEEATGNQDEEATGNRDEEATGNRDEEATGNRDGDTTGNQDEETARKQDEETAGNHDEEETTDNQDDHTRRNNPSIDEDAFDSILLGLDTNFTPLQDHDNEMENLVASIVSDKPESKQNKLNSEFSRIAIMISHPHGGAKSVSSGLFSSRHFGGEFYDTHSCLGTCGAPIISFSDDGHLYLTDIIHSGTTDTADHKVEKFGLSHFNESLYYAFSGVACV